MADVLNKRSHSKSLARQGTPRWITNAQETHDQTQAGSLFSRSRGREEERPWERGWHHLTIEYKTKRKCGRNSCNCYHHSLLHSDPPPASGISSILDRNGILPLVLSSKWPSERGSSQKAEESTSGFLLYRAVKSLTLKLAKLREQLQASPPWIVIG